VNGGNTGGLDRERFAQLMARLGGFEGRPLVAVGVSGGADSTALALLVHEWATERGGSALALTVDHRLRAESATEAETVGRRMTERGIPHETLVWEGAKPNSGIQEAAREARLRLLLSRCETGGILHLALGQHLADQGETVLMRVARGSGVDGLAGTPPVRWAGEARIIRPLLDTPGAATRDYCRASGAEWIEDPSNHNPAFARGRLRAASIILAAEGMRAERLNDTARRAGRARNALESSVATFLGRAAEFHPEGWVCVDPAALTAAPVEIALRALAKILDVVGGREHSPRDEAMERLIAEIKGGDFRVRTLGGCVLMPRRERVVVAREPDAATERVEIAPGRTVLWDSRFRVSLGSDAGEGLAIAKLGEDGWHAATETRGDLVRLGLVLPARLALPGLWRGRRLVGVPGFLGRPTGGEGDRSVLARFTPPVPAAGPPFPVV